MKNHLIEYGVSESEQLYIIGNGFDIHHKIKSEYCNFKDWIKKNGKSSTIDLIDIFFNNDNKFWSKIEQSLGEYNESSITDWCVPDNPTDFKYDHPGAWQASVEDSIPYFFGTAMDDFRDAFNKWVDSINIRGIKTDLLLPKTAKYLTFNYTDTLESAYGIPPENVLHIHGNRLVPSNEYIFGHGISRDINEPYIDETIELPYQNAYSEVIATMNNWRKDPQKIIKSHGAFFESLSYCKGVCVMGLSYNKIDMPYLEEIAEKVDTGCQWVLMYYSKEDYQRAYGFSKKQNLFNPKITRRWGD